MNPQEKNSLLKRLRQWRDETARKEGVENFRVLSNQTLIDIVEAGPKTKEELMWVKGIKEKKFAKYGREILSCVKEDSGEPVSIFERKADESHRLSPEDSVQSVGDFLERLNDSLLSYHGRVQGEISSLDIRGNYLFFGLKDKKGDGMMSCFMWKRALELSGVELAEGLEVIVTGAPNIYKPMGKLSFQSESVELVGEGALKKAYDALKKKLDEEGVFQEDRKKPLPLYPERIGLITSSSGAVIHDFLNNIGKFGFKISFFNSRVEGALAVKDLVAGVRYFKMHSEEIDVLVVIRGGGSLESLQAFNNEALVREIASCPFPVLVGIGHDKDVPLVTLVSDRASSTPTATAKLLNSSWEHALSKFHILERDIFYRYAEVLGEERHQIMSAKSTLDNYVKKISKRLLEATGRFSEVSALFSGYIRECREVIHKYAKTFVGVFVMNIERKKEVFESVQKILLNENPERQLKLGYSLVYNGSKLVRNIRHIKKGDELKTRVADGEIISRIEKISDGGGADEKL